MTDQAYNATAALIKRMMSQMMTAAVVKVVELPSPNGVAPTGLLGVQCLVNQIDDKGVAVPHGTVHHVPYVRIQGGTNAIILDPKVGDIGFAVAASRDISSVKSNKGQSNPGSRRSYDTADFVYFGGILNGTPTNIIQVSDAGITVTAPISVTITTPTLNIDADTVAITGAQVTHNGKQIGDVHKHTEVEPGAGQSGPPI